MPPEQESYTKSSAEKRLALIKSQLVSRVQEDSFIGRQLKTQNRKDLSSQLQPLVAQVELIAGKGGGAVNPTKVWGQMGMTGGSLRGGKPGKIVSTGGNYLKTSGGGKTRVVGSTGISNLHTGSTTILDPGARWTTEGYQNNKSQPTEVMNQYRRGTHASLGKGFFATPTQMNVVPATLDKASLSPGQALAAEFKKRQTLPDPQKVQDWKAEEAARKQAIASKAALEPGLRKRRGPMGPLTLDNPFELLAGPLGLSSVAKDAQQNERERREVAQASGMTIR